MKCCPFHFLLQNAVNGCKEKYHNTCTSSFSMLENKNNSCEFKWYKKVITLLFSENWLKYIVIWCHREKAPEDPHKKGTLLFYSNDEAVLLQHVYIFLWTFDVFNDPNKAFLKPYHACIEATPLVNQKEQILNWQMEIF